MPLLCMNRRKTHSVCYHCSPPSCHSMPTAPHLPLLQGPAQAFPGNQLNKWGFYLLLCTVLLCPVLCCAVLALSFLQLHHFFHFSKIESWKHSCGSLTVIPRCPARGNTRQEKKMKLLHSKQLSKASPRTAALKASPPLNCLLLCYLIYPTHYPPISPHPVPHSLDHHHTATTAVVSYSTYLKFVPQTS